MATKVNVPGMGESITSGILATWHVKDGDRVKRDQLLFELETDKITAEGLAETDGKIALKVEEGTEVAVGQTVAVIDESAVAEEEAEAPEEAPPAETGEKVSEKPLLSPAARRAAEETGVDTAQLRGSGKEGRVTKGDILEAASEAEPKAEPADPKAEEAPIPASPPESEQRVTRRKLTPLRQRIAQRLLASQREAAILSTFNEVDLTAVKALRARYQETFTRKHGIKLGFMSFFVKATVHALREVPAVNSRIEGDTLIENHFYDIGVAVSTNKGLLVPVIRDCDNIGFADVEKRIADAARRAQEGKIRIEDLEGGVFTITNGGVFGSLLSTPILNPPQSGILGMHTIQDRPVAINGEIQIRPMMYLAHSYDHRVVDGREAVTFLIKIKELLEDPSRLLLEL